MQTYSDSDPTPSPFSRLRDFLAALPYLRTPAALAEAASAVAVPFGLPSIMSGALAVHGQRAEGRLYFTNWTAPCKKTYSESVFVRDPIAHEARRRMSPFTWQELQNDADFGSVWSEVDELMLPYGWYDRLAIPIHGPAGYVGLVQFSGPQKIEVAATTQAVLLSLAHAAHQRGREMYKPETQVHVPRLTARERQVMRWIASGKTDAEIGQIFSISAATVHSYAEQAKRKLGARSRPQAVSEMALFALL